MNDNSVKKLRIKSAIKTVFIAIVLAISYTLSVITSSFYQTNKKLIILVVCFLIGSALFWLIFAVCYLITLLKIKRRAKKLLKSQITCDDRASEFFENNSYRFKYDKKRSLSENVLTLKKDALSIVKEIASIYGSGEDKYYFARLTVYDLTSVLNGVIDLVDSKVTPIFKLIKAEDKPLKVVENLLEKAIETEDINEEDTTQPQKVSLLKKIGLKVVTLSTFLFKSKIENAVTDIVKFVGFKAFETYEKNGNIIKGENKND
ncbi:MAG: hypothetical protein IKJ14_06235 [Clostridia bacterium]|nr:hypothetical protein [Clostridia bacterium]